jgi:hypothetical protein
MRLLRLVDIALQSVIDNFDVLVYDTRATEGALLQQP